MKPCRPNRQIRTIIKFLECAFENDKIAQTYINLFFGSGKGLKDEDIDLARQKYSYNYMLICFDKNFRTLPD